jgi:hypothetical protein
VDILLMTAGVVVLITGKLNTWTSERGFQEIDDAYLADLTSLSTKVEGQAATAVVSDYQPVRYIHPSNQQKH